ncbi:DNA repair-scaffolding protein isoform X2 [Microcaecilia unicolor]|uniref:DNA repair-scaffolding protein isoform X2 n=1 Tax=Microcaecilia unicolor TaxID=1415580 RepID=A0A6P7YZP6_9AMPH|nr:DNA repair-scaffolding protein isoform X2 [Microcaecilia unicolor]
MSCHKRKRSGGGSCALFPDELHVRRKQANSVTAEVASSLSKTWLRCGEGFDSVTALTSFGCSEKKPQAVKHLVPPLASVAGLSATDNSIEPADIRWSSSGSDLSDAEGKALYSGFQKQNRCGLKTDKLCNMLREDRSSEDEPLLIDWDNESDGEDTGDECILSEKAESALEISDSDSCSSRTSSHQLEEVYQPHKATPTDISEYSSDNNRVDDEDCRDAEVVPQMCLQRPLLTDGEEQEQSRRRSASDWLKSAEALLQTPQKQATKTSKTPEDSAKKRKKFLRGGLAERLNRLQNRERSSIGFWRHQCMSNYITPSGDRPGVLKLKIVTLHEECSMQVAVCQQLESLPVDVSSREAASVGETKLMVLFTKETATSLRGAPQDIIYIHPPWQKLVLHDESIPVIMNTYFCQKIFSQENTEMKDRTHCPKKLLIVRKIPSLAQIFNLNDTRESSNQESAVNQIDHINMSIPGSILTEDNQGQQQLSSQTVSDSLLEVVETQGVAGWKEACVRVVVQRIYFLPSQDTYGNHLQRNISVPSALLPNARLCLLVQDAYGIFSELQLQSARYHAEDFEQCSRLWEGKVCCLSGMKILRRTTRGRAPGLFSLIDSLWPPLVPLKVHGQSQDNEDVKMTLPPPSFCYILAAHSDQGQVDVTEASQLSDLYLPPVIHHLKEILQVVDLSHRCSFCATVLYKKQAKSTVPSGQQELWLFVTDAGLQADPEHSLEELRVVPVCVTASCILESSVIQALPASLPCIMYFRDALKENGRIICVERTILSLQKPLLCGTAAVDLSELTGPVKLDELDSTTQANTVCSVQGTVIGVDESTAFSWPVCERCGNQNLELCNERSSCSRAVVSPVLRMQLEVFLHCPSRPRCTVKVKLLEKTISSLLRFCACEDGNYEVKSVLGKKVELHCYVHAVSSHPSSSIRMEEIGPLGAENVN